MRWGSIKERIDVNYWGTSEAFGQLYANPNFPLTPFRELVKLVQYGISERATIEPVGTPILRMNNLQAEGWDLSNLKYVELDDTVKERFLLEPGDLLFNRTNSKELVGKCDVFREQGEWVFASYLIRARLDIDKALPTFVVDFLSTSAGRVQIDRVSRQIVGMSNVNAEELQDLLIPLPLIETQQILIAEMDAARASRKQKLAQADELLNSLDGWLLEQLGLTHPPIDERRAFATRRERMWERFDVQYHLPVFERVLDILSKSQHDSLGNLVSFSEELWSSKVAEERRQTFFCYVEISSVSRETGNAYAEEVLTAKAPSRARMVIREGDIIISLTRPHHGSIALIDAALDGCVASTGFAVVRSYDVKRINSQYLWAVLRTQLCLQQMLQRSSGGNYPAITKDELKKIFIPVPSLKTQERIVEEVFYRQEKVRGLRTKAEIEWEAAKQHFENQLLGGV